MIELLWPNEVRPGDVIVTMYGERRHVKVSSPPDWDGGTIAIDSYVRGENEPQEHFYDLARMVRVEKGDQHA